MQSFAIIARQLKAQDLKPWNRINTSTEWPDCIQNICTWLNDNIHTKRAFKQPQLWIWSELPDFGKTSLIAALEPYLKVEYVVALKGGFFSHYNDGADLIVFDDYNSAEARTGTLNRFLQGSPTTINVKGGSIPKRNNPPVIFTSNREIRQLYPNTHTLLEARLTEVELTEPLFSLIETINK